MALTRGTWSLRRRLVVGIVALLAVLSLVIGAISVLALRANLLTRLDDQVRIIALQAARPGQLPADGSLIPDDEGPDVPGSRFGVLIVQVVDRVVVRAEFVDDDGEVTQLTTTQVATLLSLGETSSPVTVEFDGLGAFRVMIDADGPGDTIVVAGMSLREVDRTTLALAGIFGLVALAGLIVAAVAGTSVVRVALRPLDRVAATARRVAAIPLDRGEVALADRVPESDTDPRTEVGQVGSALNTLLRHVEDALTARQASETKVRQFVADASHELRTPLASIRGYSELTRRGPHELPDDIVYALGRIESESVRMTSLVEDLLLLARLDEGRELVMSEVDLGRLVADAVSDAHAASPDHDWNLQVPDEPVVVAGDPHRLHQVVANLLANSRVHTPAGTSVTASVTVDGDDALIEVADDGPGIPDDVLPVLFERFARGDGSRSRHTGSTGLGLAIVAAVVAAHHGEVGVESTPGDTRLTVRLPLRLPGESDGG